MSKSSFILSYLKERSRAGKTSRTIEACCLLRFKIDKLINKEISVTNNSKAVDLIYNLNKEDLNILKFKKISTLSEGTDFLELIQKKLNAEMKQFPWYLRSFALGYNFSFTILELISLFILAFIFFLLKYSL